jgi:hypothetical protein
MQMKPDWDVKKEGRARNAQWRGVVQHEAATRLSFFGMDPNRESQRARTAFKSQEKHYEWR